MIANAASGDDRLDLSNILSSFDATVSNIKNLLQCIATSDRTKVRIDCGWRGDSFVDLVNLGGVSTDVMGFLAS